MKFAVSQEYDIFAGLKINTIFEVFARKQANSFTRSVVYSVHMKAEISQKPLGSQFYPLVL
jgi:hypothetical protein